MHFGFQNYRDFHPSIQLEFPPSLLLSLKSGHLDRLFHVEAMTDPNHRSQTEQLGISNLAVIDSTTHQISFNFFNLK